jgi:hypothetical protein
MRNKEQGDGLAWARLLNSWIFNQGNLAMNNMSFVGHKIKCKAEASADLVN